MLTEGAAWVPDASCLLTRALPLSFPLSPWAITHYSTEDAEGVSDRGGAANSAWPSEPRGGCRAPWLLRASPCPITLRGSNTPEVVNVWCHWTVCKETTESPYLSQPLSAQFTTSMQWHVMQNLPWLRRNPQWDFSLGHALGCPTTKQWQHGCRVARAQELLSVPNHKLNYPWEYNVHYTDILILHLHMEKS